MSRLQGFMRTKSGYSEDSCGYSGFFSWWRYATDRSVWRVLGHSAFTISGMAVVDDFGNLVEVKS